MNSSWIALAALVSVAAGAITLEFRDRTAGDPSKTQCREIRMAVTNGDVIAPPILAFTIGLMRVSGKCLSRDVARGVREVETALLHTLPEKAILVYVDTLLRSEQATYAEPWIRSAVAVALTSKLYATGPLADFEASAPPLVRSIDQTRAAIESNDVKRIGDELEEIFARPRRAPIAEELLALSAFLRLRSIDIRESFYWSARQDEWLAETPSERARAMSKFETAMDCGDRRAIGRVVKYHSTGEADEALAHRLYLALMTIRDLTGPERDALSALAPRFSGTSPDMSDPGIRESYARGRRSFCARLIEHYANGPPSRER